MYSLHHAFCGDKTWKFFFTVSPYSIARAITNAGSSRFFETVYLFDQWSFYMQGSELLLFAHKAGFCIKFYKIKIIIVRVLIDSNCAFI